MFLARHGLLYTVRMAAQASAPPPSIYQIKVSLVGISPLIWRRLSVPDSTSIAELHYILQIAMGWEDYHLHRFQIYAKDYGISQIGGLGFADNPWAVRLADFGFRGRDRFEYQYDFGDNWEHDLRIEAIVEPDPKKTYPFCIDGKRAGPPEDCGGAWQYMHLLHVLKSRGSPEKRELREWLGQSFDPAAFTRRDINAALKAKEYLRSEPGEAERS